jgi:hypothetical protein
MIGEEESYIFDRRVKKAKNKGITKVTKSQDRRKRIMMEWRKRKRKKMEEDTKENGRRGKRNPSVKRERNKGIGCRKFTNR